MYMKSYCFRQRKQTERVEPSGYKRAKNGKVKFAKNNSAEAVGGSFDGSILETMGKLGKVGLSKAMKSDMSKKAASKMVDKMLAN